MFKKKIYVVTGGFSGIGLYIAENLLKENHSVIAIGKTFSKIKPLKKNLLNLNLILIPLSVTYLNWKK